MRKEIVVFRNRNGERLFGIVHEADGASATSRRTGVILPNTGIHYRVAWHRLNVVLADRLAREGYHVFRFDPHGIGDSEGELDESTDMVRQFDIIQQGLFAGDAVAAVDLFKTRFSMDKVYLCGFCGGALTSMIASGMDPRVDGVIYVAGPVTITSEVDVKRMHPVFAKELVRGYLRRALDPRAWGRFLTGKSDYKLIKTALATRINEEKIKKEFLEGADEGVKGDLFNYKYLSGFEATVKRGGEVLFIMAEVDQATYGFENYFMEKYLTKGNPYEGKYRYRLIKNANHTFTSLEAKEQLFGTILEWLHADR